MLFRFTFTGDPCAALVFFGWKVSCGLYLSARRRSRKRNGNFLVDCCAALRSEVLCLVCAFVLHPRRESVWPRPWFVGGLLGRIVGSTSSSIVVVSLLPLQGSARHATSVSHATSMRVSAHIFCCVACVLGAFVSRLLVLRC